MQTFQRDTVRAVYCYGTQVLLGIPGGISTARSVDSRGIGRHSTAAKVESPATNLNPNPRMSSGTGYLKCWGSESSFGVFSGDGPLGQVAFLRVVTSVTHTGEGVVYGAGGQLGVTNGVTYTASLYVRGSGTVRVRVAFDSGGGGASGATHTLSGTWTRLSVTATAGANTAARVFLETTSAQVATIETGAWQFEASPHPTAYLDGSMGAGYSWVGVADQSASQRGSGRLSLPAQVTSLVHGGIAFWWRPDHGYGFTRDRVLLYIPTAGAPMELRHVVATNRFRLSTPGGDTLEVAAPSFAAGDDLLLSAGWRRDALAVGVGDVSATATRSLGPWVATGRMDLGSTGGTTPATGLHADGALGPAWWFYGPPPAEVLRVILRASTFPRLTLG